MVVLEPVPSTTTEPEPKPSAGNTASPITAGDGDVSEGYETASETEVFFDDDESVPDNNDVKNKDLNDVITDQLEQVVTLEESKEDQLVQNSVNQEELLAQMNEAKVEGNKLFGEGLYDEALLKYDHAIQLAPEMSSSAEIRAICHNNRATCFFKLEKYEDSVKECTKALELNPTYMKPLLRKAEAHEKLENYDDAITVLKKILELDPSNHQAKRTIFRLEPLAIEKREKMKEEMLGSPKLEEGWGIYMAVKAAGALGLGVETEFNWAGSGQLFTDEIRKLKDMGNSILGRFGMSVDNFKAVKDPNTGSYSISFQQ
ncbi:acetyltransferase A, auxiliary subunit [Artemisia annua]|uniref:Acetyltransferase A, auxiliary subunit n=1 Tax=Artemisia annua TaxID=35608 RepID=A0A2U1N2T0_ARTAN|nr:acetyltransferase A, auxiliary subunit [Artemisia annua]